MPYIQLTINTGHKEVDALIRRVIESQLEEAHYLLAATRPAEGPNGHFARASAILLLSTVAATSALSNFEKPGYKRQGDRARFIHCVESYFPWEHISIEDDQHRPELDRRRAAAEGLYKTFRNPLIHVAGLVHGSATIPVINKTHPGHTDINVAERRLEDLARRDSLEGHSVIKLERKRFELQVDYFYWCVRKLVERYAADPKNAQEIIAHAK